MTILRITWYDSFSIDKWQLKEFAIIEASKLMECETVGFVLSKTRELVTVCHTVNTEGACCGVIQIPRKCICKIQRL